MPFFTSGIKKNSKYERDLIVFEHKIRHIGVIHIGGSGAQPCEHTAKENLVAEHGNFKVNLEDAKHDAHAEPNGVDVIAVPNGALTVNPQNADELNKYGANKMNFNTLGASAQCVYAPQPSILALNTPRVLIVDQGRGDNEVAVSKQAMLVQANTQKEDRWRA